VKLEDKLPQIIALIVAVAIIFLIIQPYFGIIAFSALLAYLTYPLYKRLRKKINENGAAVVITTIALSLTVLAAYYGITIILNEFAKIYQYISRLPLEAISPTVEDILRQFVSKTISSLSGMLYTLPSLALSFLIFFIALFYLLRDGDVILKWGSSLLPFSEAKRKTIIRNMHRYADAFVHVQLVIGMLQGILAGVGFYIFGLPYPLLVGIMAGLLSVLPVLGPYLVYLPIGIFITLQGNTFSGLGILTYGLVLASILDYIVRPYLIGRRAEVHPLIVFVGILGGLRLLGIIGVFIGPILLAVAVIVLKEIRAELMPKSSQ